MAARNYASLGWLERFSIWTTEWEGSSVAFIAALALTLTWIVTGPLFRFSDTWQLVMNTVSSIVTFLMVFLLQRSQNKDSLALQVKWDELIASQHGASNSLINVEDLPEEKLREIHDRYEEFLHRLGKEGTSASSIEDTGAALRQP